MANCLIACGSNQGDRTRWLNAAVDQLHATSGTRVIGHSSWLETRAIGQVIRQGTRQEIRRAPGSTTADDSEQSLGGKLLVEQSADEQQAAHYLNGAIVVDTTLAPLELLNVTQQIEARLGRMAPGDRERWGPRTIDLDLLLYDDLVLLIEPPESRVAPELPLTPELLSAETRLSLPMARLEIPHPRLCYRGFVLEPACAVAGDWQHPLLPFNLQQLWQRLLHGVPKIAVTTAPAGDPTAMGEAVLIVQQAAAELSVSWQSLRGGVHLLQAGTSIPGEALPPDALTYSPQLLVILADLPLQMTAQPAALSEQSWQSGKSSPHIDETAGLWPEIPRIYLSTRDPRWALRELTAAWSALQPHG